MEMYKVNNTKCMAILAMLICITFHGAAQKSLQDVVYLKNGSVIRGHLVEQAENDIIKLETSDRSIWVFTKIEVDSVNKEAYPSRNINFTPKGLYNVTAVSVLAGRNNYRMLADVNLHSTFGYQFNAKNAIGATIGIVSFDRGLVNSSLQYRRYFKNAKTSPYISAYGGYAIPFRFRYYGSEHFGGVNFGGNLGIRQYITNHAAIDFSLGFGYQKTVEKDTYYDWWTGVRGESMLMNHYKRISINVGFLLN